MTQLVNRRVGSYWVVILYWSKKSHWHQGALVTGRKQRGSFSRWSLLYGCILYTLPARYIYTRGVIVLCRCAASGAASVFFLLTLRDEQIYKADQRTRAQQLLMHMLWNQKNKAIYKPSESLGFPVLSARARGKWRRPPAIQIIKNFVSARCVRNLRHHLYMYAFPTKVIAWSTLSAICYSSPCINLFFSYIWRRRQGERLN